MWVWQESTISFHILCGVKLMLTVQGYTACCFQIEIVGVESCFFIRLLSKGLFDACMQDSTMHRVHNYTVLEVMNNE